jgi:hypothetical protein
MSEKRKYVVEITYSDNPRKNSKRIVSDLHGMGYLRHEIHNNSDFQEATIVIGTKTLHVSVAADDVLATAIATVEGIFSRRNRVARKRKIFLDAGIDFEPCEKQESIDGMYAAFLISKEKADE